MQVSLEAYIKCSEQCDKRRQHYAQSSDTYSARMPAFGDSIPRACCALSAARICTKVDKAF